MYHLQGKMENTKPLPEFVAERRPEKTLDVTSTPVLNPTDLLSLQPPPTLPPPSSLPLLPPKAPPDSRILSEMMNPAYQTHEYDEERPAKVPRYNNDGDNISVHSSISKKGESQGSSAAAYSNVSSEIEEDLTEKSRLLYRFKQLNAGPRKYSFNEYDMHSPLHDIKAEVEHIMQVIKAEEMISFYRSGIVYFAGFVEKAALSQKLLDIRLKGYQTKLTMEVEVHRKYDRVLEELYYENPDAVNFSPFTRLMMMLVFSMIGYHHTQSLAPPSPSSIPIQQHTEKPSGPDPEVQQIMRQMQQNEKKHLPSPPSSPPMRELNVPNIEYDSGNDDSLSSVSADAGSVDDSFASSSSTASFKTNNNNDDDDEVQTVLTNFIGTKKLKKRPLKAPKKTLTLNI